MLKRYTLGEKVACGHPGAFIFSQARLASCFPFLSSGTHPTTGRALLPLNLHQRVRRQHPPEEEEEKSHLIKENIKAELFVQQWASD